MTLRAGEVDQRRGIGGGRTHSERQRAYCRRLRVKALAAYGGVCLCCGESEASMLCLDHVDGGGDIERRASPNGCVRLMRLKREGWPTRIQLLCANCNQSRAILGECAHGQS